MKVDMSNRLAGATDNQPGNPSTNYCWGYDAFGNRTIQAGSSAAFQTGSPPCVPASGASFVSTWANFNQNNQVTGTTQAPGGLTYNAAGGVVNDGVNQYLYDGEGRICAVATGSALTGYIYNAEGQRVAKGTISAWSCDPSLNGFRPTNDYILGLAGEQVTEMAVAGNNTMAWQHTNVYAAGTLLATYDSNGLHFYLNDPLGTRRAQTDYAGVLEQTCSSLPFGDGLSCTNSTEYPTEHHFTGKERDTESGLDYFGARYYSSSIGRFMSPDWSVKVEPVPYSKLDNPQSLNLYSYVFNNPLSNVDPDGHACGGLYMNGGSGFCQRATEYGKIDAMSGVQSQTRFFAAANAVSQALADVATPLSGMFVSSKTANFLEGVGENLQKLNESEAMSIQNGSLSGPNLDGQLVHNEQSSVQGQLNNFQQSDPMGYMKAIGEINGSLNSTATKMLEQLSGTDRAYAGVLAGVRKDLGRDIDFSKQGDREAIGNALIQHVRQTGGCDLNGSKQAGCQ
jgi:RHS repeat-associated protein